MSLPVSRRARVALALSFGAGACLGAPAWADDAAEPAASTDVEASSAPVRLRLFRL